MHEQPRVDDLAAHAQGLVRRVLGLEPAAGLFGRPGVAELLGDRWTVLIVRTLLLGPRRFTDLMRAFPGMSSHLLTEHIKSLVECEVVRSYELPPPAASVVYALTPRGSELRAVIAALAEWGNQTLGEPDRDHVVTPEAVGFFVAGVFSRGWA